MLWSSSSVLLHDRHIQISALFTSSRAGVYLIYCKKMSPSLKCVRVLVRRNSSTFATQSMNPSSLSPALDEKLFYILLLRQTLSQARAYWALFRITGLSKMKFSSFTRFLKLGVYKPATDPLLDENRWTFPRDRRQRWSCRPYFNRPVNTSTISFDNMLSRVSTFLFISSWFAWPAAHLKILSKHAILISCNNPPPSSNHFDALLFTILSTIFLIYLNIVGHLIFGAAPLS